MLHFYKNSIIHDKLHEIEDNWYINITIYYNYGFLRYKTMFMSYKIDVTNDSDLTTRKKLIQATKKIISDLDYKLK